MSAALPALTAPTGRRVRVLPGVYAPQHDTHLLLRALAREAIRPGADVIDLGTGSGLLAVAAARRGANVTAVDVARRAVLTARLNALIARRRVAVHRGDLAAPVPGRTYDLVISNPPYVPSPHGPPPRRGSARAWDAGPDGRAVVDRICEAAPSLLRAGGVLLMVHSGLCGTEKTLRRLAEHGLSATVSDVAHVPFGPVVLSRMSWLHGRDLLDRRADREELVVVRAEQR
ncbi:Release factor glutamine methyltransferase [Streptomyces sp. ADI96-02]|uniref:HemK2/MTQ2 family protein methyltransferase n=1 Tax=Streptomyces sp. ADI96-02 TaxID=1522760 RepID=UPI000FB5CE36|nr:HemK2/MTQ2 family protein methyltransferase [Streptomyces sp. ADI96-02]RPK54174.1 Release factor glutamine methyltransferase [Streptomyces sp. ADI96-02]